MKTNRKETRRLSLSFFALLISLLASAETVQIDGIWYSLVEKAKQAELTRNPDRKTKYRGNISIPSTIVYNGTTYYVTGIGDYAFNECHELTSVFIPEGITRIGIWAFYNCDRLSTITLPESLTIIKDGAFLVCSSLTSINIPESVTSIGERAFRECSSLTSISIPESVKSLEDGTFYGCSSLSSIIIPNSITNIGSSTFFGCSKLTSIIIPKNVTSIGGNAFAYCSGLTSFAIPESVTNLGSHAFIGCSKLTSVTIPDRLTEIPSGTFQECSNLSSIIIPEEVTIINEYAFLNCNSLGLVILPKSLRKIEERAFANCFELSDLFCYAETIPTTQPDAFENSYLESATLHVSTSTLDSYIATAPWSSFGTIVELGATITRITLDKTFATLTEGETLPLAITTTPDDADANLISWSSSNSNIATVTNDGRVTAVAPGTATITATANDGSEVSASCEITVSPASYAFTLLIDEEVFYTDTLTRGSRIESVIEPQKEGYTFSGWGEIPEVMPAHDVTLNATFIINKYLVTYKIDGIKIATDSIEYNATIVAPNVPEKEGYTFNGWGEIAETMPAHDLVYESSYSVNSYTLTFIVDEEVYAQEIVEYGTTINAPEAPAKEGYEFVEWSGLQKTMPAKDITVTATYKSLKPVYLAIRQADNGCVKLKLFEGASCTFIIEAIEGWAINAVTFNGEDITSQLEDGNTFTTPEMLEDAVLNISYEKIDDSIEQAEARKIAVRGHNGIISISGAEQGETITIYTLDGTMVANKTVATEITSVEVPTGKIYLVKVADKVVKIGM